MIVKIAIQCTDKRTRQVGDFGFKEDRPMYSVTPVFTDLPKLFDYLRVHKIAYE